MNEKDFSLLKLEVIKLLSNAITESNDLFDLFGGCPVSKGMKDEFSNIMNNTKSLLILRFGKIQRLHNGQYQQEVVQRYQWLIDIIKSHFSDMNNSIDKEVTFNTPQFFITTNELDMVEKELGVNTNMVMLNNIGSNVVTVTCKFKKLE